MGLYYILHEARFSITNHPQTSDSCHARCSSRQLLRVASAKTTQRHLKYFHPPLQPTLYPFDTFMSFKSIYYVLKAHGYLYQSGLSPLSLRATVPIPRDPLGPHGWLSSIYARGLVTKFGIIGILFSPSSHNHFSLSQSSMSPALPEFLLDATFVFGETFPVTFIVLHRAGRPVSCSLRLLIISDSLHLLRSVYSFAKRPNCWIP